MAHDLLLEYLDAFVVRLNTAESVRFAGKIRAFQRPGGMERMQLDENTEH